MAKKVAVYILGRWALIESVSGQRADTLLRAEDKIVVRLSLEKPVENTSGFCVQLPVRSYTQGEFIAAVINDGEYRLGAILDESRAKREQRLLEAEHKLALARRAAEIRALIGLD